MRSTMEMLKYWPDLARLVWNLFDKVGSQIVIVLCGGFPSRKKIPSGSILVAAVAVAL